MKDWHDLIAVVVLAGVLLLFGMVAHAARAQAAQANWYGIYDTYCYESQPASRVWQGDAERFGMFRAAGLDLVLNYCTLQQDPTSQLRYADAAQDAGLQVIWNLADFRYPLATALAAVDRLKGHPGTWGFYTGDEAKPGSQEAVDVTELDRAVQARSTRGTLYVSRPKRWLLEPFAGMADFSGPDPYPICNPPSFQDPGVYETAAWAGPLVRGSGRQLAMVLQAFSWSVDYVDTDLCWPSAAQVAAARQKAEDAGSPKVILWFCAHCITDYALAPFAPPFGPAGYWNWIAPGLAP